MTSSRDIIILGASARAAAFSALRAGLRPWCADLFADQDLQTRCSNRRVPFAVYPKALEAIAENGPPGPWTYTGGLENHPALIRRISEKRVLWGNKGTGLALARRPLFLEEIFQSNGICFPKSFTSSAGLPQTGRWLAKPLQGAGGAGIHFVSEPGRGRAKQVYFQQFIEGVPCSAVFAGFESDACFLGATRQLVGERWLHAGAFHYCGSIGPLKLDPVVKATLEKVGNLVNRHCCLRGLFGVDFILADRIPWPVEINPRYTASVEILEYALGIRALSLHRSAFDEEGSISHNPVSGQGSFGKAILFAKSALEFPEEGPWTHSLAHAKSVEEMPDFADIPNAGHIIESGRPILTFFSKSSSVHGCIDSLKQIARDLDHCLWKT
jgi:predicted ATP-grasp superfamily ATP-dependent carboligase